MISKGGLARTVGLACLASVPFRGHEIQATRISFSRGPNAKKNSFARQGMGGFRSRCTGTLATQATVGLIVQIKPRCVFKFLQERVDAA